MKKIVEIEYGSKRYNDLLELRHKILQEPLGMDFIDSFAEGGCLHIACIDNAEDKVVGGFLMLPVDNDIIRIMQVAVDENYQGQGIGQALVKYAEEKAKEIGYKKIIMHARISAVDFYFKLGYKMIGNVFEEKGVSFLKMGKKLIK